MIRSECGPVGGDPMIWAVVPTAGKTRREGRPKVLLPFGRKIRIKKVVPDVMKFPIDGISVVRGAERKG